MSKKFFLAATMLCATVSCIQAQAVFINADSVLSRIESANLDVRAARSNYGMTHQGINVARSAMLPSADISLDLNYIGDGTILDRDFSNAMRDKLPHFGNTLKVNIYQPIYHGGAISAAIDMAQQQSELASLSVKQQTDASGIEALRCYFDLQKMHNLRKVYVDNIELTNKLIENITDRHRQGTALRNDITRYRLRLSSLQYDLQSIDNSISVLNTNLVSLLALGTSTTIVPSDTVNDVPDLHNEEYWLTLTAAQSSDLKAVDITHDIASTELRMEKAARLPQIGLVVGDQLAGPVTFEIPAINKNYNAWYVGVSIRYNLSSLWTTNKKETQKRLKLENIFDRRKSLEEALNRRIHEAYVAVIQACQMLETERLNVQLANENYDIVKTRFDNDMVLLTEMLDASTAKLDSEVRMVNARINILLSYYQLRYISGTLI